MSESSAVIIITSLGLCSKNGRNEFILILFTDGVHRKILRGHIKQCREMGSSREAPTTAGRAENRGAL